MTSPSSPNPSTEVWTFISQNALVSAVLAGLILALVAWLIAYARARRDRSSIHAFLRRSAEDGEFTFRTTHAIAAATKIPEARVAELCSRHPNIKRNEQERQSWRIV